MKTYLRVLYVTHSVRAIHLHALIQMKTHQVQIASLRSIQERFMLGLHIISHHIALHHITVQHH